MLYLIEDAAPEPAQFGALPALFARTLNADLRCAALAARVVGGKARTPSR